MAKKQTRGRATTQKDIAERLKVSVMTVSKALQGHPDISDRTRELVLRTAREMRYTVNVVARNLVQRRTQTIGVVVPDISEPFFAEMIRAIERRLREHDYNLLLADSDNDPEIEVSAVRMLLEKRVDGCILGPTEKSRRPVELLRGGRIPFVLVNTSSSFAACEVIGIDRADGARQSISHLLASGYEDIYHLSTYEQRGQSRETTRGCYEAFDAFKRARQDLHVLHCPGHDLETFYQTARDQVHDHGRRIGLFVWDDEMAVGVYRAVVEKGWEIPEQVGIVGFDDVKISRFLPKALTTVAHPKAEMGRMAADRLIQCLGSERRPAARRTQLAVSLIQRETTSAPPGRPRPASEALEDVSQVG
jgi:LacI family transcriptional regulator